MTSEHNQDDVIIAYEPDLSLQKMIGDGVKFNDLLTPEIRQACQKLIDDARDSFFDEEKPRVEKLRELVKSGKIDDLSKIAHMANEIRAQARMFGFSFICNLSEQMVNFAQLPGKATDTKFLVLSRFSDALYIAVLKKMRDEGGELERELNLSIEYLKN